VACRNEEKAYYGSIQTPQEEGRPTKPGIVRSCHANDAVDEVRRAEFFRKSPKMRDLIKGKRWLLLSRWKHLDSNKQLTS
jgi:hypothetical protein